MLEGHGTGALPERPGLETRQYCIDPPIVRGVSRFGRPKDREFASQPYVFGV